MMTNRFTLKRMSHITRATSAVLLFAGSASFGSTITHSTSWHFTFSGDQIEENLELPEGVGSTTISIPQFDPSIGTLNSVTEDAGGTPSFGITWDYFFGPGPAYIDWGATPYGNGTSGGKGGSGDTYTHTAPTFPDEWTGNFSYAINDHYFYTSNFSNLNYVGTGDYTLMPTAAIGHTGMTGGASTGEYQGTLIVSYDYTPSSTLTGSFSLGTAVGSGGIYTHDCSTLTITGDLVVGDAGTDTFNQDCGLITVQGETILGKQSTGNGTYNLSSNGRLITNNDLTVGKYGTGTFNQSGGTNTVSGTLRIAKETGSHGTYNLSGGSLVASNIVNNGAFNFTGGTLSATTLTGTGATTVDSGRTLSVNQLRQGSLTVNGSVSIAANGSYSGTVIVNSLSVGGSGKLDLNDNDLIVNTGNFSTLQALVLGGYRGGPDTTATGIVSSTSQNVHGGMTILALFDNSLAGLTVWPTGSATTVASTAIIGKYTYIGDTNMDGQVTPQDYTAIDSNVGTSVDPSISWFYGDTNFDGSIDASDYAGVDGALGFGVGSPLAVAGLASVPEPAFGVITLLSLLPMRRRRRS
jgi:hypothetical protein